MSNTVKAHSNNQEYIKFNLFVIKSEGTKKKESNKEEYSVLLGMRANTNLVCLLTRK
jgi:hypothetical protein